MDHLGADEQLANVAVMEDDSQKIHISDVIDVIQMDTEHPLNSSETTMSEAGDRRRLSIETAHIVILEQPASKALRFRYECEGRSAGSIPGVNSSPENKTYPTIQVLGYKGRAAVIVSCVTKDPPYRPHPHNLVGKEGCKKGVFTQHVSSNNMIVSFSNLGIQCVKKKDIEEALRVREEIRVDPFRTGFSHRSHPTGIDLNAVRLCFQVFLEGPKPNTYTRALSPVVSEPIYDKKAMSDLVICKLSDASASVMGGKEMILLCEKVAKEDIQIRFYEERENQIKWEAYADFQPSQVHKQVAISFRTPRYESLEVSNPVNVFIQLKRPSDGATSEALPFQMLPVDSVAKRKRPKYDDDSSLRHDKSRMNYFNVPSPDSNGYLVKNEPPIQMIKKEPADGSPGMYYGPGNLSPMYAGAGIGQSPQPTPVHSPQLPPVGRTPSPGDYQAHSPYGIVNTFNAFPQQQYVPSGLPHLSQGQGSGTSGPAPPISVSNPNVRSALLAGGSCTTVPNFAPDLVRVCSGAMTSTIPGTTQTPFLGDPVNMIDSMGPSLSPVNYIGNHHGPLEHPASYEPQPSNDLNIGLQAYASGVDPIRPVTVAPCDLEQLNSGDLLSLGMAGWEGNLSEQMSSNLTLSETGPSCT